MRRAKSEVRGAWRNDPRTSHLALRTSPMSDLLSPAILAALRGQELTARRTLDGALIGGHASALPGAGLEFSQYRSYRPGDDLRRVDW
ncbi:MAG: DUF58 domain-containing protein, partial [Gemmatimonadota bacterium]